jgi:hypothetical protein
VVLAVPKPLASAKTTGPHAWIDGLATLPLSAADVRESTPTALAFAAVWQQFANLPGGTDSISDAFFEIVRSQIPVEKAFENGANTKTAKALPASEQEIYGWITAHADSPVSALTPTAAMPMVDYSVVRIGALDAAATKTTQALEAALVTPAAQEVSPRRLPRPRRDLVCSTGRRHPGHLAQRPHHHRTAGLRADRAGRAADLAAPAGP